MNAHNTRQQLLIIELVPLKSCSRNASISLITFLRVFYVIHTLKKIHERKVCI